MKNWIGTRFESSSGKTPEFKSFTKAFVSFLKKRLPEDMELVDVSAGHFDISGFIKRGDKYVYFSVPDVRYNQDGWCYNILIRTAKGTKDYRGGMNTYAFLDTLFERVGQLFEGGMSE